MTLRNALGAHSRHVYGRVDEVPDSEDGISSSSTVVTPPATCKGLLYLVARSSCRPWSLNAQSAHSPMVRRPETGGRIVTNRTRVMLIAALTALSLSAGGVWLTGTLKSVSLLAIGGGLFVWALVGYFEWRVRFQRRV